MHEFVVRCMRCMVLMEDRSSPFMSAPARALKKIGRKPVLCES
jgi:hypothetical protein